MKTALRASIFVVVLWIAAVTEAAPLVWDYPYPPEQQVQDGFIVEQQLDSTVWVEISRTTAQVLQYTPTQTQSGRYCWRVFAYNSRGKSQPSNVLCETLVPIPQDAKNLRFQ